MRKIKLRLLLSLAAIILMLNNALAEDGLGVLPSYIPVEDASSIQGKLSSAGSTTVSLVLKSWFEAFKKLYPAVEFEMSSEGSGSAQAALVEGSVLIGAMSRPINNKELESFRKMKRYDPVEIRVASDALAVIVNSANPIGSISQIQLDAIYSRSRNCGYFKEITAWQELGWDTPQEIEIYFIHPNSGGSGFFKEKNLCGGKYKSSGYSFMVMDDDNEMITTIAKNRYSIGFASMASMNNSVKTLKIGKSKQHPVFLPTPANVANRKYALTRYLYFYIDKRPGAQLPSHFREFIKFIFSRQGQSLALSKGVGPLSPSETGIQLDKLLFGN